MFILIADLMPKRLAMTMPERIAVVVVRPMMLCVTLLMPLVWLFNGMANGLFRLMRISMVRNDEITSDDIYAVMDAGAEAGVIQREEHQLIENVFELQSLGVTSAMTARESLIYFTLQEGEESIKAKIAEHPHNKFLVCDHNLDSIKGFVDAKELLIRVISGQSIDLNSGSLVQNVIIIPDTLNLYEAMEYFKNHRGDFAVVMNEYALVVGIVTMNDLMSTVMGSGPPTWWKSRSSSGTRTPGWWTGLPHLRRDARLRHRGVPGKPKLRDHRRFHHVHAAQDPQAHRLGQICRLQVRSGGHRQLQD